jgi:hypothetical protein
MTAPPSPPASRLQPPSWLDLRLVLGVLLVLLSVVVGARLFASADSSVRVWAVRSDLAAGTVIGADDLRVARVRLFDGAPRYLSADKSPAGQTLTRDVGGGELLPRDAITPKRCGSLVSIPVSGPHLSPLRAGQRVDVFATAKGQSPHTDQVLRAVPVQSVRAPKGGLITATAEWSIIVRVPVDQAGGVVRAIRTADIDVVLVDGAVDQAAQPACAEPGASASPTPTVTPSGSVSPTPESGSR